MRWFRSTRTTLSIERDVARLLVVDDDVVTVWGSTPLPTDAVDGGVVDPEVVGNALRALVERHEVDTRDIYVTLPPGESSTRLVTLQPGDTVDEEAARRMAAGFWSLEISAIGWQVIRRNGQRRLFLLRTPSEAVEQCMAALERAGLQPAALEPKPLALMRAAGQARCVIADLERVTLTVVVVDDALPGLVTTWPLHAPLLATPEAKVTRLVEAVDDATQRYSDEWRGDSIASAPLVCTGAFGTHPFLQAALESALGVDVVPPSHSLVVSSDIPVQQYTANLGLALKPAVG